MRCGVILVTTLALASVALGIVCPGAPATECEQFGDLLVLEEQGANCPVENIIANCSKIQALLKDFNTIFEDWIEADMCDESALGVAAVNISRSFAEVWSSALGSVRCVGQGVMCGFTPGDVSGWASRLQEILALEAVVFQRETRVFCYGDLRRLADTLAKEVVPTAKDVCTTGGNVKAFEKSYQKAILPEVELALKRAVSKKCRLEDEFRLSSACEIVIDGRTAKGGAICGGASDMEPCTGQGRRKCCLPGFSLPFCTCNKCNGPWRRRSRPDDELRIFADRSGTKCYCANSVLLRRGQA